MPAVDTFDFTTGTSQLPDVGELSYNGCTFSPLFATQVNCNQVKDDAGRTVKVSEYTIEADGYVTKLDDRFSIRTNVTKMRQLLSEQGGALIYRGRGCDIVVNNGSDLDVAWGPVPEVLEFQPLGGGNSAKVVWRCKVTINEQRRFLAQKATLPATLPPGSFSGKPVPVKPGVTTTGGIAASMLQFNYGSAVNYGEDGYSKLEVRGVLEIPLTRIPNQKVRTLQQTADDLRSEIDKRIMRGVDLNKFRVIDRRFDLSRDKRTLDWSVTAEEMPYHQMPPDCTIVRGTYSVRPTKAGMGLCSWLCTLRATYTVRADKPKRVAWLAFHSLVRYRMLHSKPPSAKQPVTAPIVDPFSVVIGPNTAVQNKSAILIDFNVEEGLYLDSKTVTFSATWRVVTKFENILNYSGIWRKLPEQNAGPGQTRNLWAISMKDVEGSQSWLPNRADPKLDVIVDFGM